MVASHHPGEPMTPKQSELLSYVREYIHQHEYSPSYTEIAERLNLVSKSGIHRMVCCLVAEGHLTMRPNVARSIGLVNKGKLTPERAVEALVKEHAIYEDDEHEDKMIVCSPAEALATLRAALR